MMLRPSGDHCGMPSITGSDVNGVVTPRWMSAINVSLPGRGPSSHATYRSSFDSSGFTWIPTLPTTPS